MNTWVIIGATSAIAEAFCHLAAKKGHPLILVGRFLPQLEIIAGDLGLRHRVKINVLQCDLAQSIKPLTDLFENSSDDICLFLAASLIIKNENLDESNLKDLITVNVTHMAALIHAFFQRPQYQHRLIYLSSVAACKGRAKNSLYGASKAAIEIYLQGMQRPGRIITTVRLGFIDTVQTWGEKNIFYAAPPEEAAQACWKASCSGKKFIYYPFFWRFIILLVRLV